MFIKLSRASVGCVLGVVTIASVCHGEPATQPSTHIENARAHCMAVPQRKDDFAWENDRVAFRAYGLALQKQDGPQSGIDIWVKRVPRLVQAGWYKLPNYHDDNGEGLDGYNVGTTRGCGGTAIVNDGKLIASGNYTAYRIITNGPDRVVFELDYGPWDAAGTSVKETKRFTLDAGSDFNQITSTFTFNGAPLTVAVGLKLHDAGRKLATGKGVVATWEPLDGKGNGSIGCGLIFAGGGESQTISGNVCLTTKVKNGEPITYYAGGGWSKAGFAEPDTWQKHVVDTAAKLAALSPTP